MPIMHSAQVTVWGEAPKYIETATPPTPATDSNVVQVKLLATGLHQFVRSRAAGTHFTSGSIPHTPGVDGVGTILSLPSNPHCSTPLHIGQSVYFLTFQTGGSFSDILNVPATDLVALPDHADAIQVAALMNPALSSWMALRTRTANLPKDFTVLIMGATSASGAVAIPIARHLGATRVVGAARSAAKLDALELDGRVVLAEDVTKTDWSSLGHVDVILDYVYGAATLEMLTQIAKLKPQMPVQYVHIGGLGGSVMELPGQVLRMMDLTMRGAGPGSWSMRQLKGELKDMVLAVVSVKEKGGVDVRSMKDVESVWFEKPKEGERIVFVPEE